MHRFIKPAGRGVAAIRSRLRLAFQSPIKAFVLLAGVFGSLIIFTALPLTGADEEAHFIRAYGISEGDIRLYDTRYVEIPKSFRKTIGCFQTKTPEAGKVYRYSFGRYGTNKKESFDCALSLPLERRVTEKVHTTAPAYSPTTYVPQVLAIWFGKLFNSPIVVMTYFVRIAVLITYIAMVVFAIKLLPVRKWALVGVALLPYPMLYITNPGGDYMLYGLAAILTAVIVRSIYLPKSDLKKENRKLLTILTIAASLIVLPKGIFPGICFLPLVLFYGGLKHEIPKKIGIITFAAALGAAWQKFGSSMVLSRANETVNSIVDFPYAFIKTMFYRWVDTDFLYRGDYVGNVHIPGNHLGMPSIIVTIMGMLLAVYLFVGYSEKAKLSISRLQTVLLRYTSILIAVSVVVGSFAALFIGGSFLQDESMAIRGVHPRYFYAAFFMLALVPFARSIQAKTMRSYARIVIIGSVILLVASVLVLAIKFKWPPF